MAVDRTQLIYSDKPTDFPADYRLPAGQELTLSSVFARFDGAGAGGTFLACLSLYSQDEKLIARTFPDQELAAGDSARVTFAPF